jgi:hypothetical protein
VLLLLLLLLLLPPATSDASSLLLVGRGKMHCSNCGRWSVLWSAARDIASREKRLRDDTLLRHRPLAAGGGGTATSLQLLLLALLKGHLSSASLLRPLAASAGPELGIPPVGAFGGLP